MTDIWNTTVVRNSSYVEPVMFDIYNTNWISITTGIFNTCNSPNPDEIPNTSNISNVTSIHYITNKNQLGITKSYQIFGNYLLANMINNIIIWNDFATTCKELVFFRLLHSIGFDWVVPTKLLYPSCIQQLKFLPPSTNAAFVDWFVAHTPIQSFTL